MKNTRTPRAALVLLPLLLPSLAQAYSTEYQGYAIQLDSEFSVGAAMRLQDRDPALIGIANGGSAFSTNGDDGNLAFDQGELVAAAAKLTSDLTVSRGEWGVFLRGSYVYDPKLHGHDFFERSDYSDNPAEREAPLSEYRYKTRKVRDDVGEDGDLLDAYVFGSFNLGERPVAVRLGRQVINWGESTLVQHGINSMLAFDQSQLRVPGFEVDEVLIPTENLWVSAPLVAGVTAELFYQLNWRGTRIDPSGTFWSSNDFAGPGGTRANLGFGRVDENAPAGTPCAQPGPPAPFSCVPFGSTVPRGRDRTPDDHGQWGLRLSRMIPQLNDLELALYLVNFHSRLPVFSGVSRLSGASPASTAGYFVEYPEDIQLYGLSFNTTVGDWALQGEYSYKHDQPLQVDDVELLLAGLGAPSQISPIAGATLGGQYLRGYRRKDVSQVDVSVTRLYGPNPWTRSDQTLLVAEVGLSAVHGMPRPSTLAFEAPATYTPNPATAARNPAVMAGGLPVTPYDRYATPVSWGYKLVGRLSYNDVLGIVNVEPILRFDHDVEGTSPTPIVNFIEDRKALSLLLNFVYRQDWQAELGYTRYFGAESRGGLGARNLVADRDFLSAYLRYSF